MITNVQCCLFNEIYYGSRFWIVTRNIFLCHEDFHYSLFDGFFFLSRSDSKKIYMICVEFYGESTFLHFGYLKVIFFSDCKTQISVFYQISNKITIQMELSVIFLSWEFTINFFFQLRFKSFFFSFTEATIKSL